MLTFRYYCHIIYLALSDNAQLNNEVWLSLVERCVRDAEAAGSNPVTSTKVVRIPYFEGFFFVM